jgi:FhuF 2Fe-2S C-terminal domain
VAAYATVSRLGRRALWAAATDALDDALWWAGRRCGDEDAGLAHATPRSPPCPLTSASTLRLGADGSWQRRRGSCCFSYLLPDEAECAQCLRICAR